MPRYKRILGTTSSWTVWKKARLGQWWMTGYIDWKEDYNGPKRNWKKYRKTQYKEINIE